ncbi:MAG TPA: AI-2E family transporter [Verrucomicrobiae bacterium]|nr:AI-2E family transporter [Verrucomicrobiae bacterium]
MKTVDGPTQISYYFLPAVLILCGWLHLASLLLATLFAFLALRKLCFWEQRGKWLATGLFLVLLAGITYGLGHFATRTFQALPEIADKSIPRIIEFAKKYQIELPFTDYDSLKDAAIDIGKDQTRYLGNVAKAAKGATTQFLYLIVGCVVAIGIFLNPRFELARTAQSAPGNLYSRCCEQIAARFRLFYQSFVTVMGAQIVISAINTVLTAIFVIAVQLPYAVVVIGVTFLCGLLPVIGNLLSNAIIVAIGFTVSPKMALVALVFLIVVHKLEYFLNSKIVGDRIGNPLWLTLLALVLGERLMGVPGMILAAVVLNYIKLEASAIAKPTERADFLDAVTPPKVEANPKFQTAELICEEGKSGL